MPIMVFDESRAGEESLEKSCMTPGELQARNTRASRELLQVLAAQAVLGLVAAAVAGIFAGTAAGLSALLGAGAYFLPNALFALRLLVNAARSTRANPFAFLIGELIKLFATVLLLWLLARWAQGWLVWPAMLLGLILTLKGYLLLLLSRRLSLR